MTAASESAIRSRTVEWVCSGEDLVEDVREPAIGIDEPVCARGREDGVPWVASGTGLFTSLSSTRPQVPPLRGSPDGSQDQIQLGSGEASLTRKGDYEALSPCAPPADFDAARHSEIGARLGRWSAAPPAPRPGRGSRDLAPLRRRRRGDTDHLLAASSGRLLQRQRRRRRGRRGARARLPELPAGPRRDRAARGRRRAAPGAPRGRGSAGRACCARSSSGRAWSSSRISTRSPSMPSRPSASSSRSS